MAEHIHLALDEALRPVSPVVVVAHVRFTDAQYPSPDEVEDYGPWTRGRVPLSRINLSPTHHTSFPASDPAVLDKVRRTFDGPEDSIRQAQGYAERPGKFPAVILARGSSRPGSLYDIMDGFHRVLAAALRGERTIDAFVAG